MRNDSKLKNRRAFGALDDQARAYVVFEPQTDDPRFQTEAYPLEGAASLKAAEDIAEVFNLTGSYLFRGGLPLTGDQIPRLHRQADNASKHEGGPCV